MNLTEYPIAQIRPERKKNVLQGHPWVFSGALVAPLKVAEGTLIALRCEDEHLGVGYYNPHTDIAIRILSRKDKVIDTEFFVQKFRILKAHREAWLMPNTNACRVVFAEADGCPGLIVDRYAEYLVAQFHTAGMNNLKPEVIAALDTVFTPKAILERSDLAVRRQEGLTDQPIQVHRGSIPTEIEMQENGYTFLVDLMKGQKTGFFLDQRENRMALQRWCARRTVLNLFCYTGGFSVYVSATAKRVASVDISAPAMALCRRNLELNGFKTVDENLRVQDVFETLSNLQPGEFDFIVVDPPSFAKSRTQIKNAIKAYTTLNTKALQVLPVGGILATASCTSHIDPLTFIKILHQSATNARCMLKVLEIREQPFDHPYNLAFPEGRYLKFVVAQKSEAY